MAHEIYAAGYKGFVGFGKQSAIGTSAQPTDFQPVSFDVGLAETYEPRARVEAAYGQRRSCTHTIGKVSVAGSIAGPLTPDDFFHGRFWACLMGNNNAVTGDALTGYTHTFSDTDDTNAAKQMPLYGESIDVLVGGDDNTMLKTFVGCFANSGTLTIPADGVVTVSSDWMGVKSELAGVLPSPTYSCIPPFEGWTRQIKIGDAIGSVAAVEVNGDISFNYTNDFVMQWGGNATRYAANRAFGKGNITMEFSTALKQNLDLYGYFKNDTAKAVQLELTHQTLAGSSSGYYSVIIRLPKVFFTGGEPTINNQDVLDQPMALEAQYDSVAGYAIEVDVVNSQSGTYSA